MASRRPRPGPAAAAFAALLALVALTGAFGAREPEVTPAGPSALLTAPGVVYLAGTQVPAPPTSFRLRQGVGRHGVIVLRSQAPMSLAASQQLFSYYLDSMSAEGWTLLGKGDPTADGWTLRWQFKTQAALMSLTTAPSLRLEVDLCPPQPYC